MIAKAVRHAREGTLVKVIKTKVRLAANRGPGDAFHGDEASDYEARRVGQAYWDDQQRGAEAIIESYPDGSRVLDVPFGTGRFVDVYQRKSMVVSGLEISDDMIRSARELRGAAMDGYDVRVGDARELPWADDSFDLIVCYRFLSSIISLGDQRIVLKELARVCAGSALLDIAIRDADAPARKRPPKESERSGVELSEAEVVAMLNEAGFEVERIERQYQWLDVAHRCAVVCRVAG